MRRGEWWHYCGVSASAAWPPRQPKVRPGRPGTATPGRWTLPGLALAVLLLHLGLLQALLPTRPAAATAATAAPAPPLRVLALAPPVAKPAAQPVPTPPPATTAPRPAAPAVARAVVAPDAALAAEPAPPLPRYPAQLPPAFEAEFRVLRGPWPGTARLDWQTDAAHYALQLQTTLEGREPSHLHSRGALDAHGLVPQRFVEGRRGRDRSAINFDREAEGGGRVRFSGPAHALPLAEGMQDRLGWLLQLAAVVHADPARAAPGAELSIWVVGPRGAADLWTFRTAAETTLALDDGPVVPAVRLVRAATRPWDSEIEVWLDPAAAHLPWRVRWQWRGDGADDEGRSLLWQRQALRWR
jgi:hypothetical protein